MGRSEKCSIAIESEQSSLPEEGFRAARATLTRDVFPHPFRMKEVEEYGTGNCEMV
jgi:hypothetical protein